jgi:Zn-dependent membrane protease YugP
MAYLFLIIGVLALAFAPSVWARWVLARHNQDRVDLPGTGGELAEHLVDEIGLQNVRVERTDLGSHYDPVSKTVRLEPRFFDGRSISAVAAATHEVGHAVQDHFDYPPLKARHILVRNTVWVHRAARIALFLAPFAGLAGRHPGFSLAVLLAGLLFMGIPVLVHLITLPVELDASYARALPILQAGRYLEEDDMPAARSVLRACALTYVAGALVSMFNLWRWIRYLR